MSEETGNAWGEVVDSKWVDIQKRVNLISFYLLSIIFPCLAFFTHFFFHYLVSFLSPVALPLLFRLLSRTPPLFCLLRPSFPTPSSPLRLFFPLHPSYYGRLFVGKSMESLTMKNIPKP